MTKEQLIDLVKRHIGGGDMSAELKSRYSPNRIEKLLEMVMDDMVYETYKQGDVTGDYSQVDNYMQTYVFPVLHDASREQYYIVLTPQPIPLPDNYAIRQVSPPKNQMQAFAPVDNVSASVWNELEVDYVSSKPGYSAEGNEIWFDDKFPKGLQNVMVKQIVPFSLLGDLASVFIPGGNNTLVFQKVVALMLSQPMPDLQGSNQNTKQG